MPCRNIAVGINEPAELGVVVTGFEVVEAGVGIEVVAPVAEGVDVGHVAGGGEDLAPGVVGVAVGTYIPEGAIPGGADPVVHGADSIGPVKSGAVDLHTLGAVTLSHGGEAAQSIVVVDIVPAEGIVVHTAQSAVAGVGVTYGGVLYIIIIIYIGDPFKLALPSLLVSNGVPMKQVQEWLGHSDFSTPANIYSHLEYSAKQKSAEAMTEGLGLALAVLL